VGVPVPLLGQGLVNAVVEVLVVGKDNVAADVVELSFSHQSAKDPSSTKVSERVAGQRTKPSGVTSVEASPPAFSFASTINHEGPF
jgi:hypothetical protein